MIRIIEGIGFTSFMIGCAAMEITLTSCLLTFIGAAVMYAGWYIESEVFNAR